ncbi:MAG: ubiquitin-like domain-containing protein, partial [Clostridia bacterium]|nr:ubiquitin-like domain-containing protein [Clostridia bacterium]
MKRAKRNRIKRTRRAMLLSSIMIFVAVAVYTSLLKQVSVDYLGDIITFKTMARTVSEAFKEKNIIISEDLVVSKDLGAALKKENKISIDAPKILAMIDEENKLETAVDAISETVEEPNGEQQNSSGAQSAPSDPQITQEEPKVEEPKKEEPKKEEPK